MCANLSYCLRIRCGELKNINSWKDEVITNNDKKIDVKVIKSSVIVFVDAGAVAGKYMRFFDKIKNNHKITEVAHLASQLEQMVLVDEVPEELGQAYLLAQKNLASGKKARNEWAVSIGKVEEKLEAALENSELYNALEAMEALRDIPYTRIFNDNGYEYDDKCKETVKTLHTQLDSFIKSIIDQYIASMYCKSVEAINTFRNHNTRMQSKLDELGYHEFGSRIKDQKEKELNNVEEIRSRQTLREDYKKYIQDSKINRFTTYMNICTLLKNGSELQERVDKYKNSLGKDSDEIVSKLAERVDELNKAKERINQDMTDIWDDLFEVKNSEDVEDLLDRIGMVLQKGISPADQTDFTELQENLQKLLTDINSIKEATQSRKSFIEISEQVKEKYQESEFDFEVLPILEEVISEISKSLDEKEETWKAQNLSLGDKSRESVHKWKQKTEFLPEYLSEDTIEKVNVLGKEADNIISEGKLEDVIFYFNKLSVEEKKECIEKLSSLIF